MKSLSILFKENSDFGSFKNAVIKLDGDFDFGRECMVELGSAYLEKYPDHYSKRNIDEVHLGYNMVRVCVIEKIIKNIRGEKRDAFRNILNDFSGSGKVLDKIIMTEGKGDMVKDYEKMASELQKINGVIDELPKGMIKERFIGGVTNIFNIFYLLKMKLGKIKDDAVPDK